MMASANRDGDFLRAFTMRVTAAAIAALQSSLKVLAASHFLDAPSGGAALLLYVCAAVFPAATTRKPCLAHVGKVCDALLEAGGNESLSRYDAGADVFDIRRAGTAPDCVLYCTTTAKMCSYS
jgi:hypothetical protein